MVLRFAYLRTGSKESVHAEHIFKEHAKQFEFVTHQTNCANIFLCLCLQSICRSCSNHKTAEMSWVDDVQIEIIYQLQSNFPNGKLNCRSCFCIFFSTSENQLQTDKQKYLLLLLPQEKESVKKKAEREMF